MAAAIDIAGKSSRQLDAHAEQNIGLREAKRRKLDRDNVFHSNGEVDMDEEESEEEEGSELTTTISRHPLDVKPLGNAYMSPADLRRASGLFYKLSEELLMYLLDYMDAPALVTLGTTCKAMYAFSRADELWRALYIQDPPDYSNIKAGHWRGTWRSTFLNLSPSSISQISCENLFSDALYRPFHCATLPLHPYFSSIPSSNAIPRLENMSAVEYIGNTADNNTAMNGIGASSAGKRNANGTINTKKYSNFKTGRDVKWSDYPFILTDVVPHWPAYKQQKEQQQSALPSSLLSSSSSPWAIDNLLKHNADVVFRAEALDWPLRTYVEYMRNNQDESPLYLFDCRFAEKMGIVKVKMKNDDPDAVEREKKMSGHNDRADEDAPTPSLPPFWTPACFADDLFDVWDVDERPDWRWLIVGPERSGSTFHVDPNGTSAWNAVLSGLKYWILFPPPTTSLSTKTGMTTFNAFPTLPPGIHIPTSTSSSSTITTPLSIPEYLLSFHKAARQFPTCLEAVVHPGEVIHVPAGWLHCVLNIEEGVALTGNFVPNGLEERLKGVLRFLGGKGGWGRGDISGFPRRKNKTEGMDSPDGDDGDETIANGAVVDDDNHKNNNNNLEINNRAEKNDDDNDDDDNDPMYLYNTFITRLRQKRPAIIPMLDNILNELETEWEMERESEEQDGNEKMKTKTKKRKKERWDAGWWKSIRSSNGYDSVSAQHEHDREGSDHGVGVGVGVGVGIGIDVKDKLEREVKSRCAFDEPGNVLVGKDRNGACQGADGGGGGGGGEGGASFSFNFDFHNDNTASSDVE